MVNAFLYLKLLIYKAIESTDLNRAAKDKLLFSDDEIRFIEFVKQIFKIFVSAITYLQRDKYIMSQFVLPFINDIKKQLHNMEANLFMVCFLYKILLIFINFLLIFQHEDLRQACREGIEKLNKWFPNWLNVRISKWDKSYKFYLYATILDHRYKDKQFNELGFDIKSATKIISQFKLLFLQ